MNTNEENNLCCMHVIVNETCLAIFKVNIHPFVISCILINVTHKLSTFSIAENTFF